MGKHLSIDAKNIVFRLRTVFKQTFRRISNSVGIPKSTVHRWIHMHPLGLKRKKRTEVVRKWKDETKQTILEFIQSNPYVTYSEIKSVLLAKLSQTNLVPRSNSTIHRWLKTNMLFTRKRAVGKYTVYNDRVRDAEISFRRTMKDVHIDDVVSIDETSVYFGTAIHDVDVR